MRDLVEILDQEIAPLRARLAKLEAARDLLAGIDRPHGVAPDPTGRTCPIAAESQAEAGVQAAAASKAVDAEKPAPRKAKPAAEVPKPPGRSTPPTSRPGWTAARGPGSCTAPGGGHAGPVTTHACAAPGCAWSISRCEAHSDQRLRGGMGGHMRAHRHGTPPAAPAAAPAAAPESPATPPRAPDPYRDTRRGEIARLARAQGRKNACGVCGEKGHGARRCPKRDPDNEPAPDECECGEDKPVGAECCDGCRALDGRRRRNSSAEGA